MSVNGSVTGKVATREDVKRTSVHTTTIRGIVIYVGLAYDLREHQTIIN
ncbi:hypothetical protein IGI67_000956 [Enterococcus sp. AZ196]